MSTSQPSAPLRTFVTADSGFAVNTEFTGAVTAGQTVTGTARALSGNSRNGAMVNITGLADLDDVESVYISPAGAPIGDFSLAPVTAGGVTAWIASPKARPWAGTATFTVSVKFRKARGAVVIKTQEFAY